MQAPSEFGFEQLITELLRGLADAIADRPGETEAQRFARHQTAIFSVMAFMPRDAMETMLAGQCVMFDHLMRDAARDLLRNEAEPVKRRIRTQLTGLGRSFLNLLAEFRRLQSRAGQQTAASAHAKPVPPADSAQKTLDTGSARPAATISEPPTATTGPIQSAAAVDPASDASPPQVAPSGDKADLLSQRGFQNRRMRRAQQFKKPAGKSASRHSGGPAASPQPAIRTG
jgi:hypothetical protein